MKMQKIAVIIPTFKPDWYVSRCLDALDKQSIPKCYFKVYIALNGPRENFEKLILQNLEKVKFNYKYCYLKESGVSLARNTLLDKSFEEYIVFIDDDDLISENYLEELYRASSPTCMGISSIYNFEASKNYLKDNYIGKTFSQLREEEFSKYKARKYFSSPWAKMLHRKMIGNVRFDTNLSKGEDSLFMAELSKNIYSLKKTNEDACYYVYERPGSASRSKASATTEIKRIIYSLRKYAKIFFNNDYDHIFIATRIAATLKHLRGLI